MNAVEIEEAISQLADQLFDPENVPYAFLEAFGNKETTIKRLRAGASNKSDLGGVLRTNNIHVATCETGQVTKTLTALKASPATAKAKAKFVLATDGVDFEAEDLASGETVACAYKNFPDRFGFFLPRNSDRPPRPFVLYSLRHTFLTRLGESGCDAWTLARITGHSNVSMSSRYVFILLRMPCSQPWQI